MNKQKPYALTCHNLNKHYHDGKTDVKVIEAVNLKVKAGEKIAILGLSGSGKTTLLNLLGGLDTIDQGAIYLNGIRFDQLSANRRALMRNRHLGFIYQFHHLLPEFSALDNVMMPLMMRKNIPRKKCAVLAKEMLDNVGLSHRILHKPAALSGGERQRVAIARALVTRPSCVLADEPTGNLDALNSENILQLITDLNQKFHISFIVVTHDRHLASRMDTVYEIKNRKLKKLRLNE